MASRREFVKSGLGAFGIGVVPAFYSTEANAGLIDWLVTQLSSLFGGTTVSTAPPAPVTPPSNPVVPTDPLDPATQKKFVNSLPNPLAPANVFASDAAGSNTYTLKITEFKTSLGLTSPVDGKPLATTVWGYACGNQGPTSPGRSFVVRAGTSIQVTYQNQLMNASGAIAHRLPVDTTIDWANPGNLGGLAPVPLVQHRHGGDQVSNADGLPEGWATPDANKDGVPDFRGRLYTVPYTYDNNQEAAQLWYHDHALGVTRLNVQMGLAGNYFIRDANEDRLVKGWLLPSYPCEIPLVIQDRMFRNNGELYYPATDPANPDAPTPTILPEFFGNVILVNGQAWPRMDAEPRKYRFRVLNGSDSRVYRLQFIANAPLWRNKAIPFFQIGTDLGLLNNPVQITQLVLAPGERADLVVNFGLYGGGTVTLTNDAPTPFPGGIAPVASTTQLLRVNVNKPLNLAAQPPCYLVSYTNLRPATGPLPAINTKGAKVRKLLLIEGTDQYGRIMPMLGTINPATGNPANGNHGTFLYSDPVTEQIKQGATEVWEIHNATVDAHPIHLHLTNFRVLNRQGFTATVVPKPMGGGVTGGYLTNVLLTGSPVAPPLNEQGRKDTVLAYPGEITRIVATFNRPGEFVWHCHILSHEDHEMMRRFVVA